MSFNWIFVFQNNNLVFTSEFSEINKIIDDCTVKIDGCIETSGTTQEDDNDADDEHDPVSMASSLLYLMANEQEYNTAYRRQFGKLPDIECISNNEDLCENQLKVFQKNTGKLVASFVASIPIPHTKFDTFLMDLQKGAKQSTFTTQNISGLRLFVEKGNCAACHNGNNLTDGQFHNVLVSETIGPGVFMPGRYLGLQTAKSSSDTEYLGLDAFETFARAEISRARFDSSLYGAFKTPTLRGLSCTSPYMHNGKFSTLKDVLKHYSSFEDVISPEHHDDPLTKPRNFNEFEIKDLLSFLLTLSPTEDACDMKY